MKQKTNLRPWLDDDDADGAGVGWGLPPAKRARSNAGAYVASPWGHVHVDAGGAYEMRAADSVAVPMPSRDWSSPALISSGQGMTSAFMRQLMGVERAVMEGDATRATPPGTFSAHTMGASKSQERTLVAYAVRPIRGVGGPGVQFATPNFRVGDLVFTYMGDERSREIQKRALNYAPNTVTAATLAQVRAFEAAHRFFASNDRAFHELAGGVGIVESANDEGTYEPLGANGLAITDPVAQRTWTRRRAMGVGGRWRLAGACAATYMDNLQTPMVTVCVKGPTIVHNYWGRRVEALTALCLRETESSPLELGTDALQREARTIRSVEAWPDEGTIDAYATARRARNYASRTGDPGAVGTVQLRTYGTHRVMQRSSAAADDEDGRRRGGALYIVGTVLDVYPDTVSESTDGTGFGNLATEAWIHAAASETSEGKTATYPGDLVVSIPAHCGMDLDLYEDCLRARARAYVPGGE